MLELFQMVDSLEMKLMKKEQEVNSSNSDAHTIGRLNNVRTKIQLFKKSIGSVSKDPTLKERIFKEFYKTKLEIEEGLEAVIQ